MRLLPEPFEMISAGKKTVEIRLFDEKRRRLSVGDSIVFRRTDGRDELAAEIVALHTAPDFGELFRREGMPEKAGFCGASPEECARMMHAIYSPEAEKTYGALGIEIKLSKTEKEKL